jgi:tRNA threonylcarbamoyladenosine biosynthesis protein TsaE
MTINSTSISHTQEIATQLAQEVLKGEKPNLILLEGELGGGKTTFSQGFIQGLGVTQSVNSPTFVIMKSYILPHTPITIYHLDLYRIEMEWEVLDLDIMELIKNPQAIILIEWANKVDHLWTHIPHTKVSFRVDGDQNRTITIE